MSVGHSHLQTYKLYTGPLRIPVSCWGREPGLCGVRVQVPLMAQTTLQVSLLTVSDLSPGIEVVLASEVTRTIGKACTVLPLLAGG